MNGNQIRRCGQRIAGLVLAAVGVLVQATAGVAETPALRGTSTPPTGMAAPPSRPLSPDTSSGAGTSQVVAPVGPEANGGATQSKFRQREGTQLTDRRGRFERRGDRIIFLAHKPDVYYVVLENLALERVVRVLDESGNKLDWSVSGNITEYRTTNYLLVTRALVKSLPSEAEPRLHDDPLAEDRAGPRQERTYSTPAVIVRPPSDRQTLPSGASLPATVLPTGRR